MRAAFITKVIIGTITTVRDGAAVLQYLMTDACQTEDALMQLPPARVLDEVMILC